MLPVSNGSCRDEYAPVVHSMASATRLHLVNCSRASFFGGSFVNDSRELVERARDGRNAGGLSAKPSGHDSYGECTLLANPGYQDWLGSMSAC